MIAPLRARAKQLKRDTSGLALIEFALAFPLVMAVGGWGIELSFYTLTQLRISQYALNLADNASRVGVTQGVVQQLREADVNDVFQGTRLESKILDLTTNGRVTLSSLENVQQQQDTARVQRLHWQRCIGILSGTGYDSSYGSTDVADGTTIDTKTNHPNEGIAMPTGMGDAGREVKAPNDGGVMFVEVNYRYKPAFGTLFMGSTPVIIHYTASFIVRDNRDFAQIYNFTPKATVNSCDKHAV